jgi:DNA invertase Pin-like site-specific DNA recombinase
VGEQLKIHCYARVSTDDQSDSIEVQNQRLMEFVQQSGFEMGGMYPDEGVSAYKVWLRDRPFGKKLWDAVQPGDIVCVVAQDRLFRDVADAAICFRTWSKLGIRIFDMSKGRYIDSCDDQTLFEIIAVLANDFSRRNGQRVKAACAARRKAGKPYSRARPYGWVRAGDEYAPCQKERDLAERVRVMREKGRLSYLAIAYDLASKGIRKPVIQKGDGYYYVQDVMCLHRAAVTGYPKIPPNALRGADYEARLCELEDHATPPACGA